MRNRAGFLFCLAIIPVLAASCGPGRKIAATPSVETKASVSPAITSGQYSGITRIADNHYAVVDDKFRGGGIVFFDIDMDPVTGAIGQVTLNVPPATKLSNVQGRDCEGIAYADGMLYVSAEADQSIREFDLTGNPTGRAFTIPEEMSAKNIVPNAGFEAFTYSTATHHFWATTERPLLKDTMPRLHRLQRFNASFQPDGQYLYQMDEPLRSPAETRAYVHGISALAALEDGSLVVLEREVFVPSSIVRTLNETCSITKLYRVNPDEGAEGDMLPKQLLVEFTTRTFGLANYEGMCLGPVLRDGRQTLILIADSQGGSGGLTREYLKVVILP